MNQNNKDIQSRGSVLIMALGVLALLSMLGVALMAISRQEEKMSQAFVDGTRAQFAAESGVEYALAKLLGYNKSLVDMTGDMRPYPTDPSLPLEFLSQSSFGELDLNGDGFKEVAGSISGTHIQNGDNYRLRVDSNQAKLNINDTNAPLNQDTEPYHDQLSPDFTYASLPAHLQCPLGYDPDWEYPVRNPDLNGDGFVDNLDLNILLYFVGNQNGTLYSPAARFNANLNGVGPINLDDMLKMLAYLGTGFHPTPDQKPKPTAKGRLERILEELLNVLFNPSDALWSSNVAKNCLSYRKSLPNDRFEDKEQLRKSLVGSAMLQPEQFKILESYLALDSWQDANVLQPTFNWRVSRPAVHSDWYPEEPLNLGILASLLGYGNSWTSFQDWFDSTLGGYPWEPWEITYWENYYNTEIAGSGSVIPPSPKFGDTVFDNPNSEDVYLFKDAQTQTYALDVRSPVDINSVDANLLKALIRPLSSFVLRENPGNNIPTAEDWSVAATRHSGLSTFVWYISQLREVHFESTNPLYQSFLGGIQISDTILLADASQYYYYDESAKSYATQTGILGAPINEVKFGRKNSRFGRLKKISISTIVADALAEKLYFRIHPNANEEQSNPFTCWAEFEDYVHDLVWGDDGFDISGNPLDAKEIPAFDIYMADLVIANFNPNSRLNDFNPNKDMFLHVDKAQLTNHTTELCFHANGNVNIQSLGQVFDSSGKAIAQNHIDVSAKLFEMFRVSSQAQFMRGYNPADPGRQAGQYLGNADMETAGLKFIGGGSLDASYLGHCLQSYPEPERANPVEERITKSLYDGCLMLAVLGPQRGDLFAAQSQTDFYGKFSGSLSADYAANGSVACRADIGTDEWISHPLPRTRISLDTSMIGDMLFLTDPGYKVISNHPNYGPLTVGASDRNLLQFGASGILGPDGALSDASRSLGFDARNFGELSTFGRKGALGFWIKPAFNVAHSNRIRQFFTMDPKDINPAQTTRGTGELGWRCGDGDPVAEAAFEQSFAMYYFSHGGRGIEELAEESFANYIPSLDEWISTRSLYMHVGDANNYCPAIATTTANQSWRAPGVPGQAGLERYWFESRQWNYVSVAWNLTMPVNNAIPYFKWNVNGMEVPETQRAGVGSVPAFNFHTMANGQPNYVRFGEATSAPYMNSSADSTYANIACARGIVDSYGLSEEFGYGRYYVGDNIFYSSPEFDLSKEFGMNETLFLHSVAWTGYWPKSPAVDIWLQHPDHPRFNSNRNANALNQDEPYVNIEGVLKNPLDDKYPLEAMCNPDKWTNRLGGAPWAEQWIPFSVDIADPNAGYQWYYESQEIGRELMPNYSGGSKDPDWMNKPLRFLPGQSLKFRVHFNITAGQTLYVSPVLDDITFIFSYKNPKILSWQIMD